MKIYFSGARAGEKKLLSRVLNYAADSLLQPERISLSVAFLNEDEIRSLNMESRGVDKPTDVLSFQYLDYIRSGEKVDLSKREYIDVVTGLVDLGEVYICRSIARRQARTIRSLSEKRDGVSRASRLFAFAGLRPRRRGGRAGNVRASGKASCGAQS